jgi:hypothetical protein
VLSVSIIIIALMMEAAGSSETVVNFYQTPWRNNPEDGHLHTHCRENLKSHICIILHFNGSMIHTIAARLMEKVVI